MSNHPRQARQSPRELDERTRVRTLDLFAGAGGLTAGMSLSNGLLIEPIAAVESDSSASATYTLNHGGELRDGEVIGGPAYAGRIQDWLCDVSAPEVDLVVGGPPCQGFSTLGKQAADDARNTLWHDYARAVNRSAPRFFVLENVPAFLSSVQWRIFQEELRNGLLRDYEIEMSVLNSADFGAAQTRKRLIVIGHRKDQKAPGMPHATHEGSHIDLNTVLSDVPRRVDRVGIPEGSICFRGKSHPGAFTTNQLHFGRTYTELSLKRFSFIPERGNRFNLPEDLLAPCWKKHRTGSGDVMGRLHLDKPSVTIRTEFFKPEKGRYLHPTENRVITHLEAALIQGFPRNYQWVGTREEIARQIGNAVPIPLGRAIGQTISMALTA